jgi:hypothetical protein
MAPVGINGFGRTGRSFGYACRLVDLAGVVGGRSR